jgi:hypothetical protein
MVGMSDRDDVTAGELAVVDADTGITETKHQRIGPAR